MANVVITDPRLSEQVLARRRALGLDRWDEKWDGVWHMGPSPNDEHSRLEQEIIVILREVVALAGIGVLRHELNVADPAKELEDFRIPDISVVMRGSTAQRKGTYIAGGPDFIVEIRSPGDETYEKLAWYAKQGVREALVMGRDTKHLELYRLQGGVMVLVASSPAVVESQVIPLRFERVERAGKPALVITHTKEPGKRWEIEPAEELT